MVLKATKTGFFRCRRVGLGQYLLRGSVFSGSGFTRLPQIQKKSMGCAAKKRGIPEPASGWGMRIKVFKIGEVIQLGAERIKFRKRTGKRVPHIQHHIPVGQCFYMFNRSVAHIYKLNKDILLYPGNKVLKGNYGLAGFRRVDGGFDSAEFVHFAFLRCTYKWFYMLSSLDFYKYDNHHFLCASL